MKKYWFLMGLLILTIHFPNIFAQDAPKLAEKAFAATVYLEMTDTDGKPISYGSGFFVSPTHIVTNFHVIAGVTNGTAKLVNIPKKYPIEGFVAIDPINDLVLLQVKSNGIKPLLLGDSDKIRIGEQIYVFGNPKGQEGTFSDRTISHISKGSKKRFQLTDLISPVSSGGPVLNIDGKVIGVSFMTIIDGQDLKFATPTKYVKKMLDEIGNVATLVTSGKYISAETYWNRGITKFYLGLLESAKLDYDTAIKLKPDYVEAYHSRGTAKLGLGKFIAAIADFDKVIHLKPNFAGAYADRGHAKFGLDQHKTAIADFDKAIHLKPDYVEAYVGRGFTKFDLGQLPAAIADYDTAIRLNPKYVVAYFNRGITKASLGKILEAKQDWQKAIQLARHAGDLEFVNIIQRTMHEFK